MHVEIGLKPDDKPMKTATIDLPLPPSFESGEYDVMIAGAGGTIATQAETVIKAVPDIGYLHSGFEKLGEDLDYNQYVTIVDRMNYISPIANEVAWHHSVEKLMGIELTPRCQYLRVLLAELARISDHLLCVGAAALDLGAFTAFLYAFYQREKLYDIF